MILLIKLKTLVKIILELINTTREGGESCMPGVIVSEREPFEIALRRFKKQCEKAGIISEVKNRQFYEKPSLRRKKKQIAAKKTAAAGFP